MSVSPSVIPLETERLPLEMFMKLHILDFFKQNLSTCSDFG